MFMGRSSTLKALAQKATEQYFAILAAEMEARKQQAAAAEAARRVVEQLTAAEATRLAAETEAREQQAAAAEATRVAVETKARERAQKIVGYDVRTSQLDEVMEHLCEEKNKIENIEIQALHTITIDNDLSVDNPKYTGKLNSVNLSMIAPRVVVDGNRVINLSGSNGAALSPLKAAKGSPGDDGKPVKADTRGNAGARGKDGGDGVPGQSGGNAGSLLIICEKFYNPECLSVQLNGGNGARGQGGGNGGNGGMGSPAIGSEIKPGGTLSAAWVTNGPPISIHYKHRTVTNQPYILQGGQGGAGGNGGKAGQGGFAGKEGECRIIVANQLADLTRQLSAKKGNSGENGTAGTAGTAGKNGHSQMGIWRSGGHRHPDHWNPGAGKHGTGHPTIADSILMLMSPGSVPHDLCAATLARDNPVNFSTILLNYKVFLAEESCQHVEIMESLGAFNERCEDLQSSGLLGISISDILEEAETLEVYETEFRRKEKLIDLAPLYYSILDRIKWIALSPNRTTCELKVLEYLYVAMLGKVASINATSNNLLIIDIKGYVKNLIKNFENLRVLQADRLREYYREQYQEGIESQIVESRGFLDRLQADIQENQNAIAPAIRTLENEIEQEKMVALDQASALAQRKQQLKKALNKSRQLRIFSFITEGVGMLFPPYGSVIAGVVDAGMYMAINPSPETAENFAAKAVDMTAKVVEMQKQRGALPNRQSISHEANLLTKVKEVSEMVSPFIGEVAGFLNERQEVRNQLQKLESQIQNINAYIAGLAKYLKDIPPALRHYLQETVHEVADFQSELKNRSLIALEFSRLQIKRFFEVMKQNIGIALGGFETQADLGGIATRMNEALDISINICLRIQEHRDHMAFANYIAHLQTPKMQVVGVGPYRANIERLQHMIGENVVQDAYVRAVAAVRQWGFPFAEQFLSAIPSLNTLDYETMARNLPLIQERLIGYGTSITAMDQAILNSIFARHLGTPFYTWSYTEHAEQIESLLKGNKVSFRASVESSPWDAVKFNKIGIHLECNGEKQAELDHFLQQNYEVTLEHSGMSYYKYAGNVYQIAIDKPIAIRHSFKMQPDKITPVISNKVWAKMAVNDILLSPYTTWTIKIDLKQSIKASSQPVNLYDKFRTVVSDFKVDLVGEGSYVDTERVHHNLLYMNSYHHYMQTQKSPKPYSVPRALCDFLPGEETRDTQMPKNKLSLGDKRGGI